MALQPTSDQTDLPPASSDSQRIILTPFLTKTYQLVEDISIDSIISWNEDGTAFVVWNPAEFARDILPKYFKHNNFSSFVRQLNTYGFRKVMPDRWEFSHDCFRRGDKRLLCDIVRRKMTAASSAASGGPVASSSVLSVLMEPSSSNSGEGVFSTNSTPQAAAAVFPSDVLFLEQGNCDINNGSTNINNRGLNGNGNGNGNGIIANLMDENDRLKKENTQLFKELKQMKSMCTNIYSMMSNYNPGSGPVPGMGHGPGPPMLGAGGCGSSNSSQAENITNPLHLMASKRLLGLAAAVETQAAHAPVVLPVAIEDPILSSRLFGFQLGSKRARVPEDREDLMEQDDLLQLQQPGPR